MSIEALIFHRLQRWDEEQPAKLQLADTLATPTADHQALFTQLKKLFQFKAGKLYGRFAEDSSTAPFMPWLKDHLAGRIDFVKLSTLFAEEFKALIDKCSETFEASLLLLKEDRVDGPRLYIFAVHSESGLTLNSRLEMDTVDYLNQSRLDFALRVDLADWQEASADTPYLCLLRSRSPVKIGEAFTQVCAFQNSVDTNKETETLMDILARYTQQDEPKQANLVRKKAYDFCVEQQKLGEAVPWDELSGHLDENEPTRFAQFAAQEAQVPTTRAIRPDARKLKHLVRFSGKGHGLSLSFSSDLIQQSVLYDEKTDTLTITSIPKTLKEQLKQHLMDAEGES